MKFMTDQKRSNSPSTLHQERPFTTLPGREGGLASYQDTVDSSRYLGEVSILL